LILSLKHPYLLAALLGAAASATAQTAPGTLLLNGSVGYYVDNSDNTSNSWQGVSITEQRYRRALGSAHAGVFVARQLVLGMQVGAYSGLDEAHDNVLGPNPSYYTSTRREKSLSVGPFVRSYYLVNDKLGFYGQLAGGYAKQNQRVDFTSNDASNHAVFRARGGFATLMPGLVFFPYKKLGLELTLGDLSYRALKTHLTQLTTAGSSTSDVNSQSFNASFGLSQLLLGLSFHLGSQ
jgi:hypothetical protein